MNDVSKEKNDHKSANFHIFKFSFCVSCFHSPQQKYGGIRRLYIMYILVVNGRMLFFFLKNAFILPKNIISGKYSKNRESFNIVKTSTEYNSV